MQFFPSSNAASARGRSRTPVPSSHSRQCCGTVKSFNGTWGFVQSHEISGDIFCHMRDSPQFTGPALQPGEAVEFDVAEGQASQRNNGMHALNLQRQVAATAGTEEEHWVTGTLTKIRGGMGFCSVQGVEHDVLLGERALSNCGVDLTAMQIGECLTLKILAGPKGYHATHIQQKAGGPKVHRATIIPQASRHQLAARRVLGTLKKMNGGNGFCSVQGVADDVLVGERSANEAGINLATMHAGDSLTFEIATGPKGYYATNIQQAVNALPSSVRSRVVGSLKKTHGSNGFFSVQGVSDDVLVGERSLNEAGINLAAMQVGDNLTFEIVNGHKGYYATNILPSHAGQQVVGTLKKILGGSCFCSAEGVADDVLVGERSLNEAGINLAAMQVGDHLMFEIALGPKGYHATNIQQVANAQ